MVTHLANSTLKNRQRRDAARYRRLVPHSLRLCRRGRRTSFPRLATAHLAPPAFRAPTDRLAASAHAVLKLASLPPTLMSPESRTSDLREQQSRPSSMKGVMACHRHVPPAVAVRPPVLLMSRIPSGSSGFRVDETENGITREPHAAGSRGDRHGACRWRLWAAHSRLRLPDSSPPPSAWM